MLDNRPQPTWEFIVKNKEVKVERRKSTERRFQETSACCMYERRFQICQNAFKNEGKTKQDNEAILPLW